jgi:hypothetical protein
VRAEITAIVTVVIAFVIAQLVDRAVARRAEPLASSLPGGGSAAADTRLRLLRRLVYALILLIGIALALSQFDGIRRVATGVLASSAVLGLVVGVDARTDEIEKDAIRIVAGASAPSRAERPALEAGLRVGCLERLRHEGLSSTAPDPPPETAPQAS